MNEQVELYERLFFRKIYLFVTPYRCSSGERTVKSGSITMIPFPDDADARFGDG